MKSIIAIVAVAALALMLGNAGGVLAQPEPPAQNRFALVGTVLSYDGTDLVLEVMPRRDPEQVEVTITDETTILSAAEPAAPNAQGLLLPGARVTVLARLSDGVREALYVVVKPTSRPVPPATGIVSDVEGDVVSILLPNGTTRQYRLSEGETPPDEGQMVTVFARLRLGASPGEPPTVTGLRTMDQVRQRLQQHLDRLAGGTDLPQDRIPDRDRLMDRIGTRLQEHVEVQLQVMERLRQHPNVPQIVKDQLQTWLQQKQQVRDRIMEHVEDARGMAGNGPGGSGRGGGR